MADVLQTLPPADNAVEKFNQDNSGSTFKNSSFVAASSYNATTSNNYTTLNINVAADANGLSREDQETRTAWIHRLFTAIARPLTAAPEGSPQPSTSAPERVLMESETTTDWAPMSKALEEISSHVAATSTISHAPADVTVTSLSSTDRIPRRVPVGPTSPYSEVYVEQMYSAGYGYPCFNPRPFGNPTRIGDVGYIGSDGFRTIFSVHDPPSDSVYTWNAPSLGPITSQNGIFEQGMTLTEGIAEVRCEQDQSGVHSIYFRSEEPQAAVLVNASPTDGQEIEELRDDQPFCDFLRTNAETLYHYARTKKHLSPADSLYAVSGCIKTQSWALAVHRAPMKKPYDTLVLKRRVAPELPFTAYTWTNRASARVRDGQSLADADGTCGIDQCLFLIGYVMTPSNTFLSQKKTDQCTGGGKNPFGSDGGSSGPSHYKPDHPGDDKWHGGSNNHLSFDAVFCPEGSGSGQQISESVEIAPFPPRQASMPHPLVLVNETLLSISNADFAISHDKLWIDILKSPLLSSTASDQGPPYLSVTVPEQPQAGTKTVCLVFAAAGSDAGATANASHPLGALLPQLIPPPPPRRNFPTVPSLASSSSQGRTLPLPPLAIMSSTPAAGSTSPKPDVGDYACDAIGSISQDKLLPLVGSTYSQHDVWDDDSDISYVFCDLKQAWTEPQSKPFPTVPRSPHSSVFKMFQTHSLQTTRVSQNHPQSLPLPVGPGKSSGVTTRSKWNPFRSVDFLKGNEFETHGILAKTSTSLDLPPPYSEVANAHDTQSRLVIAMAHQNPFSPPKLANSHSQTSLSSKVFASGPLTLDANSTGRPRSRPTGKVVSSTQTSTNPFWREAPSDAWRQFCRAATTLGKVVWDTQTSTNPFRRGAPLDASLAGQPQHWPTGKEVSDTQTSRNPYRIRTRGNYDVGPREK